MLFSVMYGTDTCDSKLSVFNHQV